MADTNTDTIRIVAHVHLKEEGVDIFGKITQNLIEKSRAEPGCISYILLQDLEDKTKFCFVEEWKDEAAIKSHMEAEHFKALGKEAGQYFAGAPSIKKYKVYKASQ